MDVSEAVAPPLIQKVQGSGSPALLAGEPDGRR